mmetsp:Transcript_11994/g.50105  ORF Transcript_11994/g.50105 Transcript_11994/m.50105 type:complete len:96 (+) Transcript_11994:254-541(+)
MKLLPAAANLVHDLKRMTIFPGFLAHDEFPQDNSKRKHIRLLIELFLPQSLRGHPFRRSVGRRAAARLDQRSRQAEIGNFHLRSWSVGKNRTYQS